MAEVEKRAFEQGFAEGERAAKRFFESVAEAAAKRYDDGIAEMAGAYRSLVSVAEKNAVKLAIAIARKVIQREFHIEPNDVATRATQIIEGIRTQPGILLRVSVQDASRLQQKVAETYPSVSVQADPSIKQGDFMIDTSQTHLDGRISTQLEEVERGLLED
jgi:flagellar assembly protein FliH